MKIFCDSVLTIDIGELPVPVASGATVVIKKMTFEWFRLQQEFKGQLEQYHANFDPKLLEASLTEFGHKVSLMYAKGFGYLKVKVKPGKTDASRLVYLKLWAVNVVDPARGADPDGFVAPSVPTKKWVYVPAVHLHAVGEDVYLPNWFLQKKLVELQEKSTRKYIDWKFIVKDEIVWLEAAAYKAFLQNQLPKDLDQHCQQLLLERKKCEEARRQAELVLRADIEQERVNEPVRLMAEKARSEEIKAKALAKLNALPGWPSVNIRFREWTKNRGQLNWVERSADNVAVRQSGARAYIIFADGTSIFKPARCVTVLDQAGNQLAFLD